jgi:hypothetical protein
MSTACPGTADKSSKVLVTAVTARGAAHGRGHQIDRMPLDPNGERARLAIWLDGVRRSGPLLEANDRLALFEREAHDCAATRAVMPLSTNAGTDGMRLGERTIDGKSPHEGPAQLGFQSFGVARISTIDGGPPYQRKALALQPFETIRGPHLHRADVFPRKEARTRCPSPLAIHNDGRA